MDKNMKRIYAHEFNSSTDKASKRVFHSNPHTDVIIRSIDTGEILFRGSNKVVGAGGDMVARKIFDVDLLEHPVVIPSYNDELGIPAPTNIDPSAVFDTAAKQNDPKILLFAIGTDGCGTEDSQIFAVDYNSHIAPDAMVPFRYPMASNDLTDELRELYFGRVVEGDYVAYYFKKFTSGPDFHEQYIDGTPIDSHVYDTGDEYEVYCEVVMTITKEDAREYFIATSGIDQCKFNTMSLLYAYPVKSLNDNKTYYLDVRPLTKLNISNENLIDITKGVEIIYHVYF